MSHFQPSHATKVINADTIAAMGGGGATPTTPWCIFRNDILAGETATVATNQFLLGLETFSIDGTLDNNGRMLVL